jgi:hypothetical protein
VRPDEWGDLVRAGNDVWRTTLAQQTVRAWWPHLEPYDAELVMAALGDLANTCTSWPTLAELKDQIRYHLREQQKGYEPDDHPGLSRWDWIEAGAPGCDLPLEHIRELHVLLTRMERAPRLDSEARVRDLAMPRPPRLEVLEGGAGAPAPDDDLEAEIL